MAKAITVEAKPKIIRPDMDEMIRHLCEACYATNADDRAKAALHARILAGLLIKFGVVS